MAALSGHKTITTAGTALQLSSDQSIGTSLMVKALTTNTGLIYIGNDGAGDVSSANGMPLSPGDALILTFVGNLSQVWLDSAVNGEGCAWLVLNL